MEQIVESGEQAEEIDEPLLPAAEEEEQAQPDTEEPVVAEEAVEEVEEVEEVGGTDTRQEDLEEKEGRFHKFVPYDGDKDEGVDFLDAGEWFNAE